MRTYPYALAISGLSSLIFLLVAAPHSSGQGDDGAKARKAPQAGLAIEPMMGKQVRESKFTNATDQDLAISYGNEKFSLKAGASKSVPVPNEAMVDLRVAESLGKGNPLRMRFQGKAGPNDPKRFIPFEWAKPNKP